MEKLQYSTRQKEEEKRRNFIKESFLGLLSLQNRNERMGREHTKPPPSGRSKNLRRTAAVFGDDVLKSETV